MIGWAAVTGEVSLGSILLFAIIFFWTPPHFWALALYRSGDYERAGVPMLPVVAGRAATKRQILAYTLLLLPLGLSPSLLGLTGWIYGGASLLLGLGFAGLALRVLSEPEGAGDQAARQLFGYSILYLFLLFALMLLDCAPGLLTSFGAAS